MTGHTNSNGKGEGRLGGMEGRKIRHQHLPFFLHSFDIVHVFHSGASPTYRKKMIKKKHTKQIQCLAFLPTSETVIHFLVLPVLTVNLPESRTSPPWPQVSRWFFVSPSSQFDHNEPSITFRHSKGRLLSHEVQNKFRNNHRNCKYMFMLGEEKDHIPALTDRI